MRRGAPLLLVVLAACGYGTGNMMPRGVRSVAVQAFGNDTFYRRAEITYGRELSKELVRRAQVEIRDPHEAEAVIKGRILEIPRSTFIEDRNDRILEGGVIVRIEVRMEDARTGVPLVEPFEVLRRAEFIVPRGETLQGAIDEALRDAARDTVDRIQSWSFLAQRARS